MSEGDVAARRSGSAHAAPASSNMIWIPGGTFRMGSDKHYPEEAPVHRVTVDGFWIDHTPVTNREFRKFVNATSYVTFAEIKPDANDYPGTLPHMLNAGAGVFIAAPSVVGELLATFKEYPPSQRPSSFSIDQLVEKMQKSLEQPH
jgi:formylglycine-generating enzyme required for sulfatase activity